MEGHGGGPATVLEFFHLLAKKLDGSCATFGRLAFELCVQHRWVSRGAIRRLDELAVCAPEGIRHGLGEEHHSAFSPTGEAVDVALVLNGVSVVLEEAWSHHEGTISLRLNMTLPEGTVGQGGSVFAAPPGEVVEVRRKFDLRRRAGSLLGSRNVVHGLRVLLQRDLLLGVQLLRHGGAWGWLLWGLLVTLLAFKCALLALLLLVLWFLTLHAPWGLMLRGSCCRDSYSLVGLVTC